MWIYRLFHARNYEVLKALSEIKCTQQEILNNQKIIIMKESEVAKQLTDLKTQIDKVKTEIQSKLDDAREELFKDKKKKKAGDAA